MLQNCYNKIKEKKVLLLSPFLEHFPRDRY